jgi:GNAT superfamily N-acetyltransferase
VPQSAEKPSRESVIQAIEANLFEHSLALGSVRTGESYDGPELKWTYTGGPALNRVFGARFDAGEVDERVAGVLAKYRGWGVPVIWMLGPSTQPVNLGGHLERHGWVRSYDWVGMALELGAPPENAGLPAGLTIRDVDDEESLRMWTHVGSPPATQPSLARDCFHRSFANLGFGQPSRWRYFLGLVDGKPVARSMVDAAASVAGIYWVFTDPEARRQGIGAALTRRAVHESHAFGHDLVILQAAPLGEAIYRRMGFVEYCRIAIYAWRP